MLWSVSGKDWGREKSTLHAPHATVHSSTPAALEFAWHSMHRSIMWFRQIAQLSTCISQDQRATAFHYRNISTAARNKYALDLEAGRSAGSRS